MASHGKRSRKGDQKYNKKEDTKTTVDESSPVIISFRKYQSELDERHDKHERLVKLSRDITIESKRTIFLLHRSGADKEEQLKEAEDKLEELEKSKWKSIACELHGEDPYRFLRAYAPGLEEYIEALTFLYYQKNKELVSIQEVEKRLEFSVCIEEGSQNKVTEVEKKPKLEDVAEIESSLSETVKVHVPAVEYMCGVADLTGEMMRLAIMSVGKGDLDLPFELCQFLRIVYDAFVSYGNLSRELNRKLWTLKQSVQKVETACYTLQVRGSEIPKHMLADVISSKPNKAFSEEDLRNIDDP